MGMDHIISYVGPHSFIIAEYGKIVQVHSCTHWDNTGRIPNAVLMPAYRLRRRPTINPTLGERLVFAERPWIAPHARKHEALAQH